MDDSTENTEKRSMLSEGEPSPLRTIVGGRPNGKLQVMQTMPLGIQKILYGASLDDDFRKKAGTDPSEAAKELGIELTGSEKAILSAVPPKQLNLMIDQIKEAHIPRRSFLMKTTATLAAIVATAFGVNAQETPPPVTRGISHDVPSHTRGISISIPGTDYYEYLPQAQKKAKSDNSPIMLVLMSHSRTESLMDEPGDEEYCTGKFDESQTFLGEALKEDSVRKEILKARMVLVIPYTWQDYAEEFSVRLIPAVLFMTPDKKVMVTLIQPAKTEDLTGGIEKAAAEFEKTKKR